MNNDVIVRIECPHRPQATNTTQISVLQPLEFVSEHPPPISDPDVQKNVFRLVPDNEHHNINDIQVEVECSQRQQAESTTMISPVQTSTTIPEHPPPTSESEVQKKVLRTISEGDITEDSKIGRQPPITRQSTENKDDHKPHEPTEESDITEKSIPNREDNTKRKTTLNKDDNNQVLRKQVVLKPPKPKDNPKIKKEKEKNTSKKTEKIVSTIPELFRRQHQSEKTTPTMSDCTANEERVQTSYDSPVLGRIGAEDTSTELHSNLFFSEIKTTPDLAQGKKPEKLSISKQLSTNP